MTGRVDCKFADTTQKILYIEPEFLQLLCLRNSFISRHQKGYSSWIFCSKLYVRTIKWNLQGNSIQWQEEVLSKNFYETVFLFKNNPFSKNLAREEQENVLLLHL